MRFQRIIQTVSLVIFLALLTIAVYFVVERPPVDLYLRLDPSLIGLSALSARTLAWAFLPALIVLLSGLVFGRVFCGHICPMGTTLDAGEKLCGRPRRKLWSLTNLSRLKYWVLAFLIGASVMGVGFVFLASPLSLATRFYGLIVHPMLAFLTDQTHALLFPIFERLDWRGLIYAELKSPRFTTQYFVAGLFVGLFLLGRVAPRFWCRYVCPSGALLALTSRKPLIRRSVSDACTDCGKCSRSCPMDAIPVDDPLKTRFQECIVCLTCRDVCPVKAISFNVGFPDVSGKNIPASPGRRRFLTAGLTGAGTAVLGLTGLYSPIGSDAEGAVRAERLIRPPAARPEPDFLSRCVRCGECLAACPTNTLQPLWLKAGPLGLFSPAVTPQRGACDPHCHKCAQVCPTEAIIPLSSEDRIQAKTGTAVVLRQSCLAWEHGKPCLVCDEVCPYDAIEFKKTTESPVAVPHVIEDKCAGCGYCEHFCPVMNRSAIVVTAMGALRLNHNRYREEALNRGLTLSLKPPEAGLETPGYPPADAETAPGFTESPETSTDAAPGFTGPGEPATEPAPGFTK